MSEPAVTIRIDGNGRVHRPGATLSGEYKIEGVHEYQVASVEASILWYTEGKGDEDMAVHEFWRLSAADGDAIDTRRPKRFTTTLPQSPLSYEGRIISLRWCVRVRVFLNGNRELLDQRLFRLGDVPPAPPAPPPRVEKPVVEE